MVAETSAVQAGVRCGPCVRGYPEIKHRVARLASALHELGVRSGDRVALVLRNDIPYIEISMAVSVLGAISVPVNWHWRDAELRHLLTDSGASVVFAHTQLVPVVEAALPATARLVEVPVAEELAGDYGLPRAPALTGRHTDLEALIAGQQPWSEPPTAAPLAMIYTSGTTGAPKGVLREPQPAEDSKRLATSVLAAFGIRPGHRILLPAPLYHTAPNTHAIVAASLGFDLTIMPRFDAETMLALIDEHRLNSTQMVPTMFVRLLRLPAEVRERYDVGSMEAIVHSAAPCPVDVKRRIIEWFGPVVLEYYGATETGIVVHCDSEQWLAHPGTVGTPFQDGDVRIHDEQGTLVPQGKSGRIYLKPPSFWPEFDYLGHPGKRAEIDIDGYVTVGDIGYLDEDRFLYVHDRASDMVISGGVNIYPAEIENLLITVPGIRDVAVFGIPDAEFGESLVAHVDADLSVEQIRAHLRGTIAGYKIPKTIVIDHDLPREDSGKLFKRRLRDRY